MKTVFIILHGEKHQGGSVVGVFANKYSSITHALKVRTAFPGGWKKVDDEDYWENGCDYVMLKEYNVEE